MQINGVSQVAMAPYSVSAFNALPEFEESKWRLKDKPSVLDGFGEIVRAHQVEEFLGAALIHKHFPLGEGERLVEEVKHDSTFLSPESGISEDELTPYLWHLTCAGQTFLWTPMEFVISATVPPKVREFARELPKRTAFLRQLAEFLAAHEAQDIIGLSMLHRHNVQFDRTAELLLETPGPRERTLEVRPVNAATTVTDDWTRTYWHFDLSAKGVINACSLHACYRVCDPGTN